MRMLSSCAFSLDDFAGEGQALAAADFAAEALVGAFRMGRSCTHSIANIIFTNRIADTDNHRKPPNANRYQM
jgi:hypothetical protein